MEESKNAAKSFMDMHFPAKQPNPLKSDILDSIFPPKNQQGNAVHESTNVHNSAPADGNSQDCRSKSQGTYQKASGSVFIDASDPCYMSSSVDYGCRDYYPSFTQHPGGYGIEDREDGYDNSIDCHSKSQGTYQKASGSVFFDAPDLCHMSSSVDYGCRDYYPSSKQHPGGYGIEDREDDFDNSIDCRSKSQGTYQKASVSVFIDASDLCHMSSSVDYGCRDYYPSSKQHPGGYDIEDSKDGYDNSQDCRSKSQGTYQNASGSIFIDASDPCYMSSSVDYGCRDYYPLSKQHPGGYDIDRKDGYDYPDPENSRGEWWRGSLYY